MKLPALIFDFGNVVAHFDYRKAAERLGRGRGLSGDALLERVRPLGFGQLVREYECGRLAAEAFSAEVCKVARLEVGHDEFAAAWADIFTLNEPVAALVGDLKRAGYTLVLGSNTNDLHAAQFRRQFAATLAHFDRLVLSYEVGHVKPSREFYRACVSAAGAPAAACVFIDDLPENVDGARAAGLAGLLYRDPTTLAADLDAVLGRVP
ncbi:MAG TPA: HAD family phosphatase [Isosphaeraceae bacterium]|jgi:putative hydrolase of the HAD superfamily|nr:HAD family phosphatase [Isosphaeraceae bacterium]